MLPKNCELADDVVIQFFRRNEFKYNHMHIYYPPFQLQSTLDRGGEIPDTINFLLLDGTIKEHIEGASRFSDSRNVWYILEPKGRYMANNIAEYGYVKKALDKEAEVKRENRRYKWVLWPALVAGVTGVAALCWDVCIDCIKKEPQIQESKSLPSRLISTTDTLQNKTTAPNTIQPLTPITTPNDTDTLIPSLKKEVADTSKKHKGKQLLKAEKDTTHRAQSKRKK